MKKKLMLVLCGAAVACSAMLGCDRKSTSVNPKYSIIISGCGITVTNDCELAFGGCDGRPVYRVKMSPQESEMLYKLLQRANKD